MDLGIVSLSFQPGARVLQGIGMTPALHSEHMPLASPCYASGGPQLFLAQIDPPSLSNFSPSPLSQEFR